MGKNEKINSQVSFKKNGPMLHAMGIPLFEMASRKVGKKKKYVRRSPITLKKMRASIYKL